MLDLAKHIVNQKSGRFEPEKFEGHYETALGEVSGQGGQEAAQGSGGAAAVAFPGVHLGSIGRPSALRWWADQRRCTGSMARKLKTYQTSLGFYDLAIAAPSMKAWGRG
jgi:hypothetical protein